MAFKLVTSQELKALTKGTFGNDFDPLIEDIIIPAIDQNFPFYCHRDDFDKKERTEYLSPNKDDRFAFLSGPPVDLAQPIEVWESTALPRTYEAGQLLTHGVHYFVHYDEGTIEKIGHFAGGPQSVKVVYTGGYLTADGQDVPADLRLAALISAKILFDRREEIALQSKALEGGSFSLLQPLVLPPSVTKLLDHYRFSGSS